MIGKHIVAEGFGCDHYVVLKIVDETPCQWVVATPPLGFRRECKQTVRVFDEMDAAEVVAQRVNAELLSINKDRRKILSRIGRQSDDKTE